ncbi:glycerophosphodiester phosphodiesterase family protein [Luteitalea pratensis]|uniref:glycerophosphodiester phosphodiesterase family protein n=1 Tax=Luteitalea pratensis TaxID=1855912 RepID=UPI0012FFC74B|nr:glycerophosphodiester phosphodiesterase family protein [Luteitalea pratensis]
MRVFVRLIVVFVAVVAALTALAPSPFVIAHRGASAYAPEHTRDAYALALSQGADYVEQDLGLTRDRVLVCLHDLSLERTTNVEEVFPDRATVERVGDKDVRRWYVDDFTLEEVRRLDAGSWFDAAFKGAKVMTFQDAIDLVKGRAGIFPELKGPERLRAKGLSLEDAVVSALERNGLTDATINGRPAVWLQSFEEQSLRTLARRLPRIPRTFLIGTPDAAQRWLTPAGLREMRAFVTGIGPARPILEARPAMVAEAHAAGLTVVPWTFRARRGAAAEAATATTDMRRFTETYGVDGLFTDNPDLFPRPRR